MTVIKYGVVDSPIRPLVDNGFSLYCFINI